MGVYGKECEFADCRTGDCVGEGNRGDCDSEPDSSEANKCNSIFYAQPPKIGKKIEELKDSRIQESRKISFEKKAFDLSASGGQGNLEMIDSFRKAELGYGGASEGGSNLFGGEGNDGGYSDTGSC